MASRNEKHRAGPTGQEEIAAIGRRTCPPLGDTLIAIASAWRTVNRADLDARLDHLARRLFPVEPSGRARAAALAELTARDFKPDTGPESGLALDHVLAARRGHPVLLAAVAAELGRRAGWRTAVCSSPAAWYAALFDSDSLWLIDPTGGTEGWGGPVSVRRHCAHELAYVVLTGLAERAVSPHDAAYARALRDRLTVIAPTDPAGRALLGARWSAAETPR